MSGPQLSSLPEGDVPTLLIVNTRGWKSVRRALRTDLDRSAGRCHKLNRFGFEATHLTLRCFWLTSDPQATLAQLKECYGFGRRSAWTPEARIIGTLEHLGVFGDEYTAPPPAKAYAAALGQAVDRLNGYTHVAQNVLERVLIRDFKLTALDRLPTGLPLCEVPALAAICADVELLQRLRSGEGLRPAQKALRHRFGFDLQAPAFRTFRSVAASMNSQLRLVRGDIETELQALGINTL